MRKLNSLLLSKTYTTLINIGFVLVGTNSFLMTLSANYQNYRDFFVISAFIVSVIIWLTEFYVWRGVPNVIAKKVEIYLGKLNLSIFGLIFYLALRETKNEQTIRNFIPFIFMYCASFVFMKYLREDIKTSLKDVELTKHEIDFDRAAYIEFAEYNKEELKKL